MLGEKPFPRSLNSSRHAPIETAEGATRASFKHAPPIPPQTLDGSGDAPQYDREGERQPGFGACIARAARVCWLTGCQRHSRSGRHRFDMRLTSRSYETGCWRLPIAQGRPGDVRCPRCQTLLVRIVWLTSIGRGRCPTLLRRGHASRTSGRGACHLGWLHP